MLCIDHYVSDSLICYKANRTTDEGSGSPRTDKEVTMAKPQRDSLSIAESVASGTQHSTAHQSHTHP
jgi:hypothetical protein